MDSSLFAPPPLLHTLRLGLMIRLGALLILIYITFFTVSCLRLVWHCSPRSVQFCPSLQCDRQLQGIALCFVTCLIILLNFLTSTKDGCMQWWVCPLRWLYRFPFPRRVVGLVKFFKLCMMMTSSLHLQIKTTRKSERWNKDSFLTSTKTTSMWWSVLRRRDVRPARPVGVEKNWNVTLLLALSIKVRLWKMKTSTACSCDLVVEKYGMKIG